MYKDTLISITKRRKQTISLKNRSSPKAHPMVGAIIRMTTIISGLKTEDRITTWRNQHELLTKEYDVIIFKHCYPVSLIQADISSPDADSDIKSVENYQSQYAALKTKMHEFHGTRFILWTPAVNTKHLMTEEEAVRTRQFRDWIVNEWDEKGDNIFVWDFYELETEGGLYLKDKNALSPVNSPRESYLPEKQPFSSASLL